MSTHVFNDGFVTRNARNVTTGGAQRVESLAMFGMEKNVLLAGLERSVLAEVLASGEVVRVALRDVIYAADEPIRHVYFPINSVLSVVTRMKEGGMIEVGTIGSEGCSAIPLIMGAKTSANDCFCQVPGTACKITTETFFAMRDASAEFRALLDRYLQAYVNFLGQLAGCNRLHTVFERCSRWLLLTCDRVDTNTMDLTHEYLAMMLGCRRSGVSNALSVLRKAGYIAYGNGKIDVLDRSGLEKTTCECYAVAREQFDGMVRADGS